MKMTKEEMLQESKRMVEIINRAERIERIRKNKTRSSKRKFEEFLICLLITLALIIFLT